MGASGTVVFRPYRVLPVSLGLGSAVWMAALLWLIWMGEFHWRLPIGAATFAAAFALGAGYYARAAIWVDGTGVTYRGLWRSFRMRFPEVRRVEVLDGLLPVYCVRGFSQRLHFTSFFRKHQALLELLLERTGAPLVREG